MTVASLHLMVNHLPVVGLIFSLMTVCYALYERSDGLKRWALILTVIVGLFAIPTFFTGEPAEEVVEELPGVSEKTIHRHEEAAELSFYVTEALAVTALGILLVYRRRGVPRSAMIAVLAASLVTGALLIRTSHLGGKIRHTEFDAPAAEADASP